MKGFTKLLTGAALFCLIGQAMAQHTTSFRVTDHPQQTIDGFGASDAWSMWRIGEWEDSLQTKVADWLFSMEMTNTPDGNLPLGGESEGEMSAGQRGASPKGIGLSIWRFNAGAGSATQGDAAQINRDTRTEYFEKQTGQRRFLKLAKERGVPTFLAFYNSPPVHLTQNGLATNTGRDGTFNLKHDAYDDFAAYIADMLQTAEREDGIHFDYVCPVNEPDGHWNWIGPKQEGSPATNREVAHIAREMSKEFVRRGITTKILVNESSDFRCMFATHQTDWQRGYEIQAFWNPDSTDTYVGNLPNIAHVMAGHSYWTNTPVLKPGTRGYERTGLYGYRKRLREAMKTLSPTLPRNGEGDHADREGLGFWMTELCIMSNDEEIHGGGGFDFSMEEALYVARVMHYDLTVANARSWQWWRAAGGNYKDGLIRMYVKGERTGGRGQARSVMQSNGVRDSKLMWTLGNFSRFVRPGAVRLDVEGKMEVDGLMLSAYKNTDGTLAIVAINYGKEDRPVSIDLSQLSTSNFQFSTSTAYRTSDVEGENLRNVGEVDLKNAVLPARSVTTLIIR